MSECKFDTVEECLDALRRGEIVERVPIMIPSNAHDKRYLDTKKEKMGHLI